MGQVKFCWIAHGTGEVLLTCPQNRWSFVDLPKEQMKLSEQVELYWLAHRTCGVMLTCPQNRWSHVDLPLEQVILCWTALRTGGVFCWLAQRTGEVKQTHGVMLTGPRNSWSYVDLPTEQVKLSEHVELCWLAHRTVGVMLTCPQNRVSWSTSIWPPKLVSNVDLPTEQVSHCWFANMTDKSINNVQANGIDGFCLSCPQNRWNYVDFPAFSPQKREFWNSFSVSWAFGREMISRVIWSW